MEQIADIPDRSASRQPQILPVREQAILINEMVRERLETILPRAMRDAGLDAWLVICQEDNPDPIFETMIPRNVRLSEAPSHGMPAILYDAASRGSQGYLTLAEEMLTPQRPAPVVSELA